MMLIKILTSQAHLLMMILGHEIEGELIYRENMITS